MNDTLNLWLTLIVVAACLVVLAPSFPQRRHILALARLTFLEAIRKKVLIVFVLFALIMIGVSQSMPVFRAEDRLRVVETICFWSIFTFGMIVAIFVSALSLPGDLGEKTIYTVATKPVRRSSVILGKLLGFAGVSAVIIALMGAASLLTIHYADARVRRETGAPSGLFARWSILADQERIEGPGLAAQPDGRTCVTGENHSAYVWFFSCPMQFLKPELSEPAEIAVEGRFGPPPGFTGPTLPLFIEMRRGEKWGVAVPKDPRPGEVWRHTFHLPLAELAPAGSSLILEVAVGPRKPFRFQAEAADLTLWPGKAEDSRRKTEDLLRLADLMGQKADEMAKAGQDVAKIRRDAQKVREAAEQTRSEAEAMCLHAEKIAPRAAGLSPKRTMTWLSQDAPFKAVWVFHNLRRSSLPPEAIEGFADLFQVSSAQMGTSSIDLVFSIQDPKDPKHVLWKGTAPSTRERPALFTFPAQSISPDGTLRVAVERADPITFLGIPDELRFGLYARHGSFDWNFVKALLVIFFQLVLLAAVAVAGSTFLSAPVSVIFAFFIFFCGNLVDFMSTAAKILTWSASVTHAPPGVAVSIWEHLWDGFNWLVEVSLPVAAKIVPNLQQFDVVGHVMGGDEISFTLVANALVYFGAFALVAVAVGEFVFWRKEIE